jgi:glycerophosphoryl diester phosphodiesterase
MRIIAHRGVWESHDEQNSLAALIRANDLGFGIETDVWALNDSLVISHDPPQTEFKYCHLDNLMDSIAHPAGPLCINVKSDGCAALLKRYESVLRHWEWYAFDMSMPETIRFQGLSLPFLERVSEIEYTNPAITPAGRWLDCFHGQLNEKAALDLAASDSPVFVVSPELHGHSHLDFWEELSQVRPGLKVPIAICTDFPVEAMAFFEESHS